MLEHELLNQFYRELFELIGEEATYIIYQNYRGLNLTVPKKLYDSKKIAGKLSSLDKVDLQTKQEFARKYDYSQRQIERLLLSKQK
ncbi:hypothetical protein P7D85_14255 [Enterococcus hulanensis]|uniref:Mor transcription activator domain-containing protein n=1 Tax=Enterococcus hulanensis TaxID=2559929 RepID=A0ABU3F1F9_9ENTE|nr:hypothetical protein [Enterococcus hulanensis]MDT2600945.1 hypothetical protein [Enterococcus hulanensis]MDT2611533.1 hypothetical protein [Enterococcus hulanensis]MDT2617982.1 hypothetical protein [Enterococcus hulanensis]MDT2628985.1 hypothetical protein [Enterococcus hulanensis]MDT2656547.1 hypothetical protein [Enterococcus hulanensis]